ncbi:MAG: hypothetical protein ACOC7L_01755 [Acidobacteriota bacterium]
MRQGRDRQRILDILERVLTPHIGPLLAHASTRSQCEKLGIEEEDEITPEQLEELVEALGLGLAVFVGRPKAGELVEQMRRVVLAPEEPE